MDQTLNKYTDDALDMSVISEGETSMTDFVTTRTAAQGQVRTSEINTGGTFDDFKMEMRQLFTYLSKQHQEDLATVNTSLQEIKESNQHIKETNQHIQSTMEMILAQNEELKKRVNELESEVSQNHKYIFILENKLEENQISTRKGNFEIKNVPKKNSETKQDLIEMVLTLSNNIACPITKSDIRDVYRVRGKNPEKKNTPIIVETNSAILKNELLRTAKLFNTRNQNKLCAKHLGYKTLEDTPIYLSEHLTAKGSRLHFLARDVARTKGYKYCWTAYGKVYLRKDETSPIMNIVNEEQVHHLLQNT